MRLLYKKTIIIALLLALAVVGYATFGADRGEAKVAFLDVGQGDSILISLPGSTQILIDGGPTDDIATALGRHIPFYDREIELVILTHPHADHLRGINAVLERYQVRALMLAGIQHESRTYERFFELLKSEGAQTYLAKAGDRIEWDGQPILAVLSPERIMLGEAVSDPNQTSVVTELNLGGLKFLLPGDAEVEIERQLSARGLLNDVDVLKVSHSGSRGGTSENFLAVVRPEVAVISVGKNSYGHPAAEVLERLQNLGSKILRTDEQGDIVWTFRAK